MKLNKSDCILMLFLLTFSLALRLPYTDTPLSPDGAEYIKAAEMGFFANYLDKGTLGIKDTIKYYLGIGNIDYDPDKDVLRLRHQHPPLLIYLICLFVHFFGFSEVIMRAPSILFGSLTPVLLYVASLLVFDKNKRYIGFMSGFILAITPVHVYASKVASWHAMFTFFVLATIFSFVYSLKKENNKWLYITFVLLAISYLTLELALGVLISLILSLILIKNKWIQISKKGLFVSKTLILAPVLSFFVFVALWPAGIVNIFKNHAYFFIHKMVGSPTLFMGQVSNHLPWWTYIYWSFTQFTSLFLIFGFSLIFSSYLFFTKKLDKRYLPILLCLLVLLSMTMFHPRKLHYLSSTLPLFSLLSAISIVHIINNKKHLFSITILLVLILSLFNIPQALLTVPGTVGYKDAAQYFETEAEEDTAIFSWYSGILSYYLPEYNLSNYFPLTEKSGQVFEIRKRNINIYSGYIVTDEDRLKDIQSGKYEYLVFYYEQVELWPEDKGYLYAKENCTMVKDFPFELTEIYNPILEKNPNLWIYSCLN